MRRRTWILTALGVAAVLALAIGIVTWEEDGTASPTFREYPAGERPAAPPIDGELLTDPDQRLDVADLRGQVVVVNVWGAWCPPCRVETRDLEEVYQATRELGVEFVGVNVRDRDRDRAIRFADGRKTYPSIYDYSFRTGLGFEELPAPPSPPATLVIDRSGQVAATFYRQIGQSELETVVREVAAENGEADPVGAPDPRGVASEPTDG